MTKFIAALDQLTTSTRCIIFDKKGRIHSVAQKGALRVENTKKQTKR